MLYRVGFDYVLHRCLTLEKDERVLNECHSGACGSHMLGYAITHKIVCAIYLWPSIFKYCIRAVQRCHECQIYNRK